jgi:hypothetical protein
MLTTLLRSAHWLDLWLRRHAGRPYTTILAIGLVLSIGASATSLGQTIGVGGAGMKGDVTKTVAVVILQAALLINQLAQLDEGRARRRRRRMLTREKARVAAAGPER